ncbi:MAG: hypothetical protein IJR97_08330 [Clostridia bacterium]|nr:hypothetical protein [Clostridia bacterium]
MWRGKPKVYWILIAFGAVILFFVSLLNPASLRMGGMKVDPVTKKAAEDLLSMGYAVPEGIQEVVSAWRSEALEAYTDLPVFRERLTRDEQMRFNLLWTFGAGETDRKTGKWTPFSDRVYAFDAEAADVEHMYGRFLEGIQAIVPDIRICEIAEDVSGTDDDLGGTRTVSFQCSGHPYQIELPSRGGWIDGGILSFINGVLDQEGCEHRIHEISDEYDQLVILIYDTPEKAAAMKKFIDIH